MKKQDKIVVGCDIVNFIRFKKAMIAGGQNFLERVFTLKELQNPDPAHLAGIFAAKEAAVKALELKPGSWQKLEVVYQKNDRPSLKLAKHLKVKIKTADLSIAHDGDYAISVFVAILA